MIAPLLSSLHRPLSRLVLTLVALVALLLPLAPAHATALPGDQPQGIQEWRDELTTLQNQQGTYTAPQARRLADLSRLDTAITDPSDRPTIANGTSHQLGIFVRSKRQPADEPATFVVLGSGHETDDDVETTALFIPANVPLSWPGRPAETGATPSRVVRLLPGQELQVSDSPGSSGYRLNLPAFAVDIKGADLAVLPSLSQSELDAQPETAPVD